MEEIWSIFRRQLIAVAITAILPFLYSVVIGDAHITLWMLATSIGLAQIGTYVAISDLFRKTVDHYLMVRGYNDSQVDVVFKRLEDRIFGTINAGEKCLATIKDVERYLQEVGVRTTILTDVRNALVELKKVQTSVEALTMPENVESVILRFLLEADSESREVLQHYRENLITSDHGAYLLSLSIMVRLMGDERRRKELNSALKEFKNLAQTTRDLRERKKLY